MSDTKYIETIGRRKTSVARVRVTESSKQTVVINSKTLEEYFPVEELRQRALAPLTTAEVPAKFSISVVVKGGGISSQAGAVSHGIARALNEYDAVLRKPLKSAGLLKRDPRAKERRKFGLKKARKAPQWSKR